MPPMYYRTYRSFTSGNVTSICYRRRPFATYSILLTICQGSVTWSLAWSCEWYVLKHGQKRSSAVTSNKTGNVSRHMLQLTHPYSLPHCRFLLLLMIPIITFYRGGKRALCVKWNLYFCRDFRHSCISHTFCRPLPENLQKLYMPFFTVFYKTDCNKTLCRDGEYNAQHMLTLPVLFFIFCVHHCSARWPTEEPHLNIVGRLLKKRLNPCDGTDQHISWVGFQLTILILSYDIGIYLGKYTVKI